MNIDIEIFYERERERSEVGLQISHFPPKERKGSLGVHESRGRHCWARGKQATRHQKDFCRWHLSFSAMQNAR